MVILQEILLHSTIRPRKAYFLRRSIYVEVVVPHQKGSQNGVFQLLHSNAKMGVSLGRKHQVVFWVPFQTGSIEVELDHWKGFQERSFRGINNLVPIVALLISVFFRAILGSKRAEVVDAVGEGLEEMRVKVDISSSRVDEGFSSILLKKIEIVLNRLAPDLDFGERNIVLSLPIHISNINELLLEFLQMEILVPISQGYLASIVGNANGEDHVLDSVFLFLNVDQSGRRVII